ncbi:MAG: BrnT family toxin [Pseudomonadota bacterium]
MLNDEFEWDDAKSASNLDKHGVSFEEACRVFRDPFAIELLDDRKDYDEERYILIGISDSLVLVIVHTELETRHRIISARKAEPNERRYYYEENA